jgi:hypothetical protein
VRVAVILENAPDCELERQVVEVADDDAVDDAVSSVIEGWVLSVGDTIRIVEVQS